MLTINDFTTKELYLQYRLLGADLNYKNFPAAKLSHLLISKKKKKNLMLTLATILCVGFAHHPLSHKIAWQWSRVCINKQTQMQLQ